MLTRLYIRNFVIIDEQDIEFGDGLNIITGETGAGKSILLGALGLVLGNRADKKVLRDTSTKAIIEVTFQEYPSSLDEQLADADVDVGSDELIMRRELLPSGKSRAFINDTPVRLEFLRNVGYTLVDLHQQFQTLEIQEQPMQFRMLDAYSGIAPEVKDYGKLYMKLVALREKVRRLESDRARSIQEKDYIEFQLDELVQALPEEGQYQEWSNEFSLLENAVDIQEAIAESMEQLRENEHALISSLRQLAVRIGRVGDRHDPLNAISTRIESTAVELEDIASELSAVGDRIDPDPQRKVELEERLDLIHKLFLKHNVQSEEELLVLRSSLEEKVKGWHAVSDDLDKALQERDYTESQLQELATKISDQRQASAQRFAVEVNEMLKGLEMKNSRFEVRVERSDNLGKHGIDDVQFLFAANKGGQLEPVGKVASGGELSRLSLCIKSVVCKTMHLPTMIFDEIDSGVSGQVALRMGALLRELAEGQQVIMITHSPQIASRAARHLKVSKNDRAEMTTAYVSPLESQERIEEIAKMLSGDPPTEAAVLNARELINQ